MEHSRRHTNGPQLEVIKEHSMSRQERLNARPTLTTEQKFLSDLWEEHVRYEFATRNTEDTLATMVEDAYVNHIPVMILSNRLVPSLIPSLARLCSKEASLTTGLSVIRPSKDHVPELR